MNTKEVFNSIKNNLLFRTFFILIPFALLVFTLSVLLMKMEFAIIEKNPNPYIKAILNSIGYMAMDKHSNYNYNEKIALGLVVINFVLILIIIIKFMGGIIKDKELFKP